MAYPRPGSVTAAAVLSIIYGSLGMLCGLCLTVMLVGQGAMNKNFMGGGDPVQEQMQKDMEDALRKEVPGYQAIGAANTILGLFEAIALLCGGIGLLSMQSWARKLTLVVCFVIIAHTIFQAIYQAVLVIPAVSKVFQDVMPQVLARQGAGPQGAQMAQFLQSFMTVLAVGAAIFYFVLIIYLFIIVMLLLRQHVRTAFAAAAAGLPETQTPPGVYEDEPGWGQDPRDDWHYRQS